MRRILPLMLAAVLCSCASLTLERKKPVEVLALEASVQGYYDDVVRAFASGDPEALASLFSPDIQKPMTRRQILDWGKKFFGEHGPAKFVVERVIIDEIGTHDAVARLTYRVRTKSGKGGFGGTERDVLVRGDGGRWVVSSWEKL